MKRLVRANEVVMGVAAGVLIMEVSGLATKGLLIYIFVCLISFSLVIGVLTEGICFTANFHPKAVYC
jgi:hypothetical protein